MADDEMEASVSEAEAAEADAAPAAASATPSATYIAQHRVLYNGREFKAGDTFVATTEEDRATAAQLRSQGALKLETEVRDASELATEIAAMQAKIAALTAERDALRAAGSQRSNRR